MQTKKALLMALPLFAVIGFASPSYALFDKEAKIQWSEVPAVVQKTVNAQAKDGKVDEVEKETKSNTAVYEVKINTKDDGILKLKVEESGKLVGLRYKNKGEEDIEWSKVPAAVQKTISVYSDGNTASKVEKETKEGGAVYEAKIKTSDGKVIKMKVGSDGKLRELETEKDWF
jgi:uncharacterized membrane protein YkoI